MTKNHLIHESSRYLQQHAHNPVDWYPWGEAAFAQAHAEDKPIFLSIGYSACHWCHVMAHESFEDEETAAFLNEHFVSIKVDREERPDLDRIYMGAVQAMTGGGGWPMTVFCTPEGTPFYGGTYFPKHPRPGLPSFTQLLSAVLDAWEHRREELVRGGEQIVAALEQQAAGAPAETALHPELVERAYEALLQRYDEAHGGWGGAPKFPQPMALDFLLHRYHAEGEPDAIMILVQTLDAMARGGIYDQLGGGFHRYTVDAAWTVPHFERMLYDNAQLARVYLHAWQAIDDQPLFRDVAQETLDYVLREMTAPEGGFYATQDADTEGEEGKFYLWTPEQVREVLGEDAGRFLSLYPVNEVGNFEGKTILTFGGDYEDRKALADPRRRFFEARRQRTPPGRDEKVLTSWNGLMLAALADAARVLDRGDYLEAAQHNADFLLRELRTSEGRLWHVWNAGEPRVPGLLEDHANLIEGLLALYQADFDARWMVAARELTDVMLAHFSADAGFYDTADDAEPLVIRPRELQDNATPSGNAMAATVLLKLARFCGEPRYEEAARRTLASIGELPGKYPLGFAQWLVALEGALATPVEIAIIAPPQDASAQALLATAQHGYHPHRLVAAGTGDVPALLQGREPREGRATAYVCRAATCRPPVTEPEALAELLVSPD